VKVLFLISGGDSGGAKTHVFALLDSLKYKCDVKMVCFVDGVFYREILEKDIDTVLLYQKSRFDMSIVDELERMIKEEGFDLVHSHGARANFIISKIKNKISIPVITTVHSDYLLDFDGIYRKIVFTGDGVLPNKDIILDSRTAWHFIPKSFKVFLDITEDEQAKRLLGSGRSTEKIDITTDEAKKSLNERWRLENNRYREIYDFDNRDMSQYDLVVDTSNMSIEEVGEEIYKNYLKYIENK